MSRKNDITLRLDLDDRKAQRGLKQTAASLKDVGDEADDARSAAQLVADTIDQWTDESVREIDRTADAVQALARELEGTDIDPREAVAGLKRLGLTAEDVEGDAEQLAGALKRAGQVETRATERGFDDVGQALGRVDDDTGRANDSMRGFIGGTVGELPLISDAMGPVGEGLGQLAEGALEGQINLKQLITVGLGMGGVAGAVMLVSAALGSMSETDAFNDEQVDDYVDAINDVGEGIEAVNQALEDTRAIEGRTGGFGGFFEKTTDVVPALVELGYTFDDVSEIIEQGGGRLEALTDNLRTHADQLSDTAIAAANLGEKHLASGEATTDAMERAQRYRDVADVLTQQHENYAEATKQAADQTAFFGITAEEATEKLERQTEMLEAQADALRDSVDAYEEQIDAQMAAADASFALRDAEDDLFDALSTVTDELSDSGGDLRARQQVLDDVAQSARTLATANVRLAEEQAATNGQTLTATQRQTILNRSLLDSAATAEGPARRAILDYAQAVNGIPDNKMTDIRVAFERGDVDEANRLLNAASRTRRAAINADANTAEAERKLNLAARDRRVRFAVDIPSGARIPSWYAKGSQGTRPGTALVGEQGPELVTLPAGSQVADTSRTREMLAGSRPQQVGNVTINMPAGSRPDDVIRALNRYRRIQGDD
jgi:hypothetical protein